MLKAQLYCGLEFIHRKETIMRINKLAAVTTQFILIRILRKELEVQWGL
jgi:hypothetical protein